VRAEEQRPHIVFIAVDDLNDWLGCLGGHPQAKTPHIDRLAKRGMLFTNAHCAAPVCLASRTAVLSGCYPQTTGVFSNWGKERGKTPAKAEQLPVRLAAGGYVTLGAGKIYHGAGTPFFQDYFETEQRWSPFTPTQVKYTAQEQASKGTDHPRHVIQAGPGKRDWVLPLNGLRSERNADTNDGESFDWGPTPVSDEEFGDTRITSWAIRQLAEPRDNPLFLSVGYYRPHIPLFAPQRDFEEYPPVKEIRLPEVEEHDLNDLGSEGQKFALDPITAGTHSLVVKHDQWQSAVLAYLACVTYVDRQVGRLMQALDESTYAENTWIILWSDHGWHLGEKQHWGKWTPWRQSTRVPLIIVPPRNQQAIRGATCAEAVSLVDLYPTLLEIARLPPAPQAQGQSLLPLLKAPDKHTDRAVLTTIGAGNYALSTRDWRYIRYHTGEQELYHIATDPNEWHNVVKNPQHKEKLTELQQKLAKTLQTLSK
jgi:arylsulfatase A-like enzyme